MKVETSVVLGLAALTSAAVLQPRQWPEGFLSFVPALEKTAKPLKPLKVVDAKPRLRDNSIRKVLRYGPFTLPAAKNGTAAGHGHGGSETSVPFSIANLPEMTLADIVKSMGGSPGGMGLPNVKMGDIYKSLGYIYNKDYENAMASLVNVTLDPNGLNIVRTLGVGDGGLCQDCTVLGVKTDFVFEDGKRADVEEGVYLHHMTALNMGAKPVAAWLNLCPTSQTTWNGKDYTADIPTTIVGPLQPLAMATVDEYTQWFTTPDGKFDSGMYIDPKDRFFMQAEVINYKKTDQQIYLQMDVEYVPGKVGRHATYTPISVTGCSPAIGFEGRGKVGNVTSEPFDIRADGTIVAARGHLHDGGTSLQLLLNDKLACTSEAVYGTKAKTTDGKEWTTLSVMKDCDRSIEVKKGDKLKLVVNFDEIAHPVRESGGMGQEEMGFVFMTFVPKVSYVPT